MTMTDVEMEKRCRDITKELTDTMIHQILTSSEEDKDMFKEQLEDVDQTREFLDECKKEIIRDIGNTAGRSLADI